MEYKRISPTGVAARAKGAGGAESRGSAVKIRRNGHYGESPIACPVGTRGVSGEWGRKPCVFSVRPRGRFLFMDRPLPENV